MDTYTLSAAATKVAIGIAIAAVLGGGSMVVGAERDNAVQDRRIQRNETDLTKIDAKLDKILERLPEKR